MKKGQSLNFGIKGWLLIIYQVCAYSTMTVFTNYPMNILADMYGGAQTLSKIYTVGMILGIVIQLIISQFLRKIKSVKRLSIILGIISLLFAFLIMVIPPSELLLWQFCYAVECTVVAIYCTFSIGILIGQWFPRKKGTVMGIATLAFPVCNGMIGAFAMSVFKGGIPNVFGAFLPYFIFCLAGWIIGIVFIKDYPEQAGAYRDNDKSFTTEIANAMLKQEIEAKKTSVWTIGHTMTNRDFWFMSIPLGLLLMTCIGAMTQSAAIIGQYKSLNYQMVMLIIAIFGCIGSYSLGVLDTKIGTRKSVIIAVVFMIITGIIGIIPNAVCLMISMIFMALFTGAASNYTVSASVQYWRREDFGNVFACVNPVANIIQAVGPMIVAMLFFGKFGSNAVFAFIAICGVVSLILILLFRPMHIKEVDDKYRKAAGKQLDDALVGRK